MFECVLGLPRGWELSPTESSQPAFPGMVSREGLQTEERHVPLPPVEHHHLEQVHEGTSHLERSAGAYGEESTGVRSRRAKLLLSTAATTAMPQGVEEESL